MSNHGENLDVDFDSISRNKVQGLRDPELWFKNQFVCDDQRHPIGYRLINGAEYIGDLRKFAAHGSGTLKHYNGYNFTGSFQRGIISGKGAMRVAGHLLEGMFENGILVEGVHQLPNGTVFYGKPAPVCRWTGPSIRIQYADGRNYDGEVLNGCPDGRGRMTSAAMPGCPPAFYEGEFTRGVRHGRGALTLPNGDVVDGDFSDGIFVGPGAMRSADGCGILEASTWKDGSPDGQGSLRFPGGTRYVGEFCAGEMTGHGRLEHPVQSAGGPPLTYEGEFANGRAHGAGCLTVGGDDVGNGRVESRFTGDWREGLAHGRGLLEEPHGKRSELRAVAGVDFADGFRGGIFSQSQSAGAAESAADEADRVVTRAQRS